MQIVFNQVDKDYVSFHAETEQLVRVMHILKEKIRNNPAELKKFVTDKLNKLQDDAVLSEEQQKQENRTVQ